MNWRRLAISIAGLILAACGGEPDRELPVEPDRTPIIESQPGSTSEGTLKIACIFPTLGRYAISGEESHRGVQIAFEDLLDDGRIHGREVEILHYRTGSDQFDVREAAEHAEVSGALAIVGSNASNLSLAIADLAQVRGIPMVSNVSTTPDLTWNPETGRNREFVFRVCHSDRNMAKFLSEFAREDLRASRAAVLYDVSRSYSRNLAETFLVDFQNADASHEIERYYYPAEETDYRRQLTRIRKFAPDVLFVPGSFVDASLIAVQAKEFELEATLLGGDSWANHLLFDRGGPAGPAYHGDHWFNEGPFREKYVARFQAEPNGGRAALAYDALGVIVTALENLGPLTDRDLLPRNGHRLSRTRDRLRQSIARVYYKGVTGVIIFDEHGDPPQKGVIVKIENGKRSPAKWLGS